ncbi:MAG: cyclophilin-like fold protein [Caldilineaceae bacterium]
MEIAIEIGGRHFRAELNDSETAQEILAALPLEANATKWGDEFYFDIPVQLAEAADARAEVEVGALAYWPPGNAFCIFFGPTPVSRGNEPRAYSPINVFGRLLDDVAPLRSIRSGAAVKVTMG